MNNVEYIPGTGTGYQDWSKNISPMINAWIDVQKYKRQKDDADRLAMMTAAIQNSAVRPDQKGPISFGGMNWAPMSLEDRLAYTGKNYDAMKDYLGMQNTMLDISNKTQNQQMWDQNFGGDKGQVIMGTRGGVTVAPKQEKKQGGSLLDFFLNRKPQAGNAGDLMRQKAINLLKQSKQPVNEQTIQWTVSQLNNQE